MRPWGDKAALQSCADSVSDGGPVRDSNASVYTTPPIAGSVQQEIVDDEAVSHQSGTYDISSEGEGDNVGNVYAVMGKTRKAMESFAEKNGLDEKAKDKLKGASNEVADKST